MFAEGLGSAGVFSDIFSLTESQMHDLQEWINNGPFSMDLIHLSACLEDASPLTASSLCIPCIIFPFDYSIWDNSSALSRFQHLPIPPSQTNFISTLYRSRTWLSLH